MLPLTFDGAPLIVIVQNASERFGRRDAHHTQAFQKTRFINIMNITIKRPILGNNLISFTNNILIAWRPIYWV